VSPSNRNQFGDATSLTTVTTVACFAYYGEASRHTGGHEGRQFEQQVGWFVILPTAATTLQPDDKLNHIYDNRGALVKEEGRVEEIVVYRHHRKGVQFVQVRLADN
jgi:hypothetical protein